MDMQQYNKELVEAYYKKIAMMETAKTVLDNHEYKYSKIYQKVNRGMIRVQYDFRKNIENLSEREKGMIVVTKLLLKGYGIPVLVEVTDANGRVRVMFSNDIEKIKNDDLVI